jgi:hypothetical protein
MTKREKMILSSKKKHQEQHHEYDELARNFVNFLQWPNKLIAVTPSLLQREGQRPFCIK